MRKFLILMPVLLIAAWSCEDLPSSWLTPKEEKQAVLYDAAASLIGELIGENVTPDQVEEMKGKSLEPKYGRVFDEGSPYERSILVKDADEAELYFCGLGGWREDVITETADGYIIDFSDIGMGALEFFRKGNGPNMGYATVDIPCIPHLKRITYQTAEQVGVNAGVVPYESPCLYGDVYLKDGRYYICTRESTGYTTDTCGILVCMETGKGSNWEYHLSKETWGCWQPKQPWCGGQYISSYLLLCADHEFTQDKAQIIKKWPGKVFPKCQRWRDYDDQVDVGDLTWGFGALEPGYSHVTRYVADFSQEKSNSDRPRKDWKDVRVIVVRDATEGDYRWSKARWWRRCHHYVLPWICKYNKGISEETHKYTSKDGWRDIFDGDPIVYTMNVVTFYETAPAGYVLQDPWDD